ncbi:MAG: glycosyltransferase family 39 protein [Candidatus Eiseniibacteriota bacterium]|nr:MAG: glycosyltransferase family 39 protein [Candidatus Eisenbacteria bacterium]
MSLPSNAAPTGGDVRRANFLLLALALAYFFLEWLPGSTGEYGYFIDEFYYVACSNHLAFGYVDHPPLSIFLLWVVRAAVGDSLLTLRMIPSLAGAATVLLTGLVARRLGAGTFGQAIAAGAVMLSSIYHVMFSFYSMNALAILMWTACFWILVEIERLDRPRLWLLFGVVAGLALQNKHTFVLLLLGLLVGLVVTRARRHLADRWLWLGFGVCVLLVLPNVLWQATNSWPSIEFYRNADIYKNVPTPPLEVLKQQFLFMNPAAAPVWLAGLVFFLAIKRGSSYRHLGVLYAVLLLSMLMAQKSRPDRIAEAYTILMAGGGVVLEIVSQRKWLGWVRWGLPAAMLLFGAALAPVGLPLLPPPIAARYATGLGVVPQIERGEGKRSQLPQWLADRLGWEEFVDDVEAAVRQMEPDERERAILLLPSYGQAGAVELLGRGRNLPPVYATQNNYAHWGPPQDPVEAAIVTGPFSEEVVRWFFSETELVRIHDCDWCMPWRDEIPIWLGRGQKELFRDAWPQMRHYE